jgi:hypothetical protein
VAQYFLGKKFGDWAGEDLQQQLQEIRQEACVQHRLVDLVLVDECKTKAIDGQIIAIAVVLNNCGTNLLKNIEKL